MNPYDFFSSIFSREEFDQHCEEISSFFFNKMLEMTSACDDKKQADEIISLASIRAITAIAYNASMNLGDDDNRIEAWDQLVSSALVDALSRAKTQRRETPPALN